MLKIPSAENWRKIVSRGKYPLLFIYELGHGLFNIHKITGFKTKLSDYCRVVGGSYVSEKQAQKFEKEVSKVLENSPSKLLGWLADYYYQTKDLFLWLKEVRKELESENLSKDALKKIYFQYERKAQKIWYWGYLAFLVDEPLKIGINDSLIKFGVSPGQIIKFLEILSASPKLTLHQREEIELLELASQVKKLSLPKCQRQIEKHWQEWSWKNSWVYMQQPLAKKKFEIEILNLAKNQPGKILSNLKKEKNSKLKARKEFLKKYKNQHLKILADILAEYTFWHSFKMEEMTKAIYLARPLFDQLAKKFGLSFDQFIELLPQEVRREKTNLKIIKERIKNNGVIAFKGRWLILTPKQVEQVKKQIEEKPPNLAILKGFVAYPGKATGRVVFVSEGINITQAEIGTDNILVTPMTTVNMVPLIKKAKAIVTDEGGILCHAAVVSREFKKPCIIGTKFATKIFKTGDLIEVDANRGIIRKIKN